MFTQAFWDDRYSGERHVWSGRPNPHLVTETSNLTPGRAIDVGCGEGADAIWLARQGWAVTGADVSPVGLKRAAANAEAARPGGNLLLAAHHPSDLEIPGLRPNLPELFCTAEELAAFLDPDTWEI